MKRTLTIKDIPETVFSKLQKKKIDDGFKDRNWTEWFAWLTRDVRLVDTPSEQIEHGTRKGLLELWVENFAENLLDIRNGRTIADLVPENPYQFPKGSAIVVGRGRSVWKYNHLKMLAESDYKGTIVSTDGMLIECLKTGITPDRFPQFYVVSVDGNREHIVKWYDHELVDKYGSKIKALLNNVVAHNVIERCKKANVQIYWFQPLFDIPFQNESFTKIMNIMTKSEKNPKGTPTAQCAGHAGGTCWVIAHALLRCSPICLIGLDLGYIEGTPLEETSYYKSMMQATGGNVPVVSTAYKTIHHPFFKTKAFVDPVFDHYRKGFRELVLEVEPWVKTINCSVGTLFGRGIECMWFESFLKKYKE